MKFIVAIRVSVLASMLVSTYARRTALDKTGALLLDDSADDEEESTGLTVSEETRIFGGSEADATQFPFIVSLRKSKADASTYCGGTLVASQYVLTAGHCVKTDETTIYASIGSAFAKGAEEGQQIKVIEGYRHPLYNKSGHLYDVGVLKLEKKVSTATIGLGAADGSDNKVGTAATVRGWGITENGSQSSKLEEVDVRIISNDECSKQYKDRITETMLCAGNGKGKDSCNGDSGGPLIANGVLVGVVSWGGKCGANSGVYTRVSYVRDFISDIVHGGNGARFSSASTGQNLKASTDPKRSPAAVSPTVRTPSQLPTRVASPPVTKAPSPVPIKAAAAPVAKAPSPVPIKAAAAPAAKAPSPVPIKAAAAPAAKAPSPVPIKAAAAPVAKAPSPVPIKAAAAPAAKAPSPPSAGASAREASRNGDTRRSSTRTFS
uniref:Peptidase S1 domain-containing protein n=1 Tax=Peronospora matthiolae TaxID=2874970 RepID=A0AAV1UQE8_9STRA